MQESSTFEYKFATNGPDGTFEGYGAVFNNEDDGGDVVMPGAFDGTLARHKAAGTMPKMLLHHGGMAFGSPSPDGMVPIGKWNDMTPDSRGLQVKGRLINLNTDHGRTIYGAMKEGELSGLSMGYKATDFERGKNSNEPRRKIKAVDLYEVSLATFPMNALAAVTSVKLSNDYFAATEEVAAPRFVEGVAITFNAPHWYKEIVDIFMPGCCDRTLENKSRVVSFLEGHDYSKKITDTAEGNLELRADFYGLNFRVRIPETPRGVAALALIGSGAKARMSPGYNVTKSTPQLIDGFYVRLIHEIELCDISFCSDGYIPQTFAQPIIDYESAFTGKTGQMQIERRHSNDELMHRLQEIKQKLDQLEEYCA
jgi:HK97 family phage prohead protease